MWACERERVRVAADLNNESLPDTTPYCQLYYWKHTFLHFDLEGKHNSSARSFLIPVSWPRLA